MASLHRGLAALARQSACEAQLSREKLGPRRDNNVEISIRPWSTIPGVLLVFNFRSISSTSTTPPPCLRIVRGRPLARQSLLVDRQRRKRDRKLPVDANERTQGAQEALGIGELGAARLSPMLDEGVELFIRDCRAIRTQHSLPLIEQTDLIALSVRALGGLKRTELPPKYPERESVFRHGFEAGFLHGVSLGVLDGSGKATQQL
jgi:hypothetical protein